jgi:hypothetical protein
MRASSAARAGRGQLGEDRRHLGEAVAQRRRLARLERAEDGAGQQALGIAGARQGAAQPLAPRVVGGQLGHRLVAPGDRRRIAQRPAQPLAQRAAARRRGGAVEDAEQRGAAAAEGSARPSGSGRGRG